MALSYRLRILVCLFSSPLFLLSGPRPSSRPLVFQFFTSTIKRLLTCQCLSLCCSLLVFQVLVSSSTLMFPGSISHIYDFSCPTFSFIIVAISLYYRQCLISRSSSYSQSFFLALNSSIILILVYWYSRFQCFTLDRLLSQFHIPSVKPTLLILALILLCLCLLAILLWSTCATKMKCFENAACCVLV